MRIIGKECRKIFDLRCVLILCVLTVLLYAGGKGSMMQVMCHPAGGQCTDSPYDIPFVAKLVKQLGPTVKLREWEKLEKVQEKLEAKKEASFEAQAVEGITEKKGFLFGVPKETAKQWAEESGGTVLYQRAYYKRLMKKEASLLPEGAFFILQSDMQAMARHLLICFFILVIPYQVRERLRGVMPLFVTTRAGRKIFGIQLLSSVLSCLCVGVLQLFLYAGIFIWKGLGVFFSCPAWSYDSNNYWSDGLSFGGYMAVYSLLVLFAAVAVVVLIYQIGRMSVNYIIGIAISIPVGFLIWNIHSRFPVYGDAVFSFEHACHIFAGMHCGRSDCGIPAADSEQLSYFSRGGAAFLGVGDICLVSYGKLFGCGFIRMQFYDTLDHKWSMVYGK